MRIIDCHHIFKITGTYIFPLPALNKAPHSAGIYFVTEVVEGFDTVIYIGSTQSLKSRLSYHKLIRGLIAKGKDVKVFIAPMHYRTIRHTEYRLISKIKPMLNTVAVGWNIRSIDSESVVATLNPCLYKIDRFSKAAYYNDVRRND